jgi:hypothetical protein
MKRILMPEDAEHRQSAALWRICGSRRATGPQPIYLNARGGAWPHSVKSLLARAPRGDRVN